MIGTIVAFTCLLSNISLWASNEKRPSYPSYDYQIARAHEIKPHRRTIPLRGVRDGDNELRLTLIVSPTGDVLDAKADDDTKTLKFWPQLQGEVRQWKFTPFEENGKAVTAEVEEILDLVPPERFPRRHVAAPDLRPDSNVTITLERSGCYGMCPSYTVTIGTDAIVFDGRSFVVASGKHADRVDAAQVRKLAKSFVTADFYSMNSSYRARVTDNPTYVLSIVIDGRTKEVEDYVGSWVGMPAVITELEDAVDALGRTERWIAGSDGLVQALRAEKFDFHSPQAQVMLKRAVILGKTATVKEFLEAGVPLGPLPAPAPGVTYRDFPTDSFGWLTAASRNPDTLQVLIAAGARKNDQNDIDSALFGAAGSGNVQAARALIAYGANPNVDLSEPATPEKAAGMTSRRRGEGSVLISAAASGNPEMVREILRYHPNVEARGYEGRTAVFTVGEYRSGDKGGARVECLRLLVQAGADVNARDKNGNTPLHRIFLTDVQEELLKLGANVNARNKDGETPIFTVAFTDALAVLIEHGADLTLRNNKGETAMEALKKEGPARIQYLREAIRMAHQN